MSADQLDRLLDRALEAKADGDPLGDDLLALLAESCEVELVTHVAGCG